MTDQEDTVEINYSPEANEDEPETHAHDESAEHETEDMETLSDEEKSRKSFLKRRSTPNTKKLLKQLQEQEETIEKVVKERDDYKDKYLRSLADMDNFRKRTAKEKDEYRKYVLSDFILNLLEVFDNLERALQAKSNATSGEKSIIAGVEMIFKQLQDLLKKNNVTEIDALNKPFDPNMHQALSKVEQEDISQPMVIEVYQKGFLYNGKLLRPSFTKVAIPIEKEVPKEKETAKETEPSAEDCSAEAPGTTINIAAE